MLLSLGIAGIPFVGADIPGFYGNATDEVMVMFYQLGGWYPFMRAHSHIESLHREPFLQSELVKRTIKDTVFLRYELMHYIYTAFYEASVTGVPIMRSMWLEFPGDAQVAEMSDQFMFGGSILVSAKIKKPLYSNNRYFFPVSEDDDGKWWSIDVYLPSMQHGVQKNICWYFYANKLRGREDLPQSGFLTDILLQNSEYGVYVKGGSILPIKLHGYAQAILRTALAPIRLDIYLDFDRAYAEGELYIDDGESFAYETKKEQSLIRYKYKDGNITCESLFPDRQYPRTIDIFITEINVYGLERIPYRVLTPSRQRAFRDFEYSKLKQTLTIKGFRFPLESLKASKNKPRRLAEVQFE